MFVACLFQHSWRGLAGLSPSAFSGPGALVVGGGGVRRGEEGRGGGGGGGSGGRVGGKGEENIGLQTPLRIASASS